MANDSQPPKKRGCLFYGCLTLIFVGLLGVVLTYLGYRYAMNTVSKLVNEYTDTTPALIEKVEISQPQLAELRQRVATFGEALDSQKTVRELALSADDINALLAHDPAYKEFQGKFFVVIDGDRVKGKLSLPLEDLGPLKLKGRYLNGEAGFKVSLVNGVLLVTLETVEVKGKALPGPIFAELKKQNLAQDILQNPKNAEMVQKFDSIQVKDGMVILKNKVKE